MSGYEEEHNIPAQSTSTASSHYRRPDLSTFFSNLETLDTSAVSSAHALPTPGDTSALFRQYANGLQIMLSNNPDGAFIAPDASSTAQSTNSNQLVEQMIDMLMGMANDPPREVNGMPESYFDELDRVSKSAIKKGDSCPICANEFLDDKYPLVVRLPCKGKHEFDLECIRPWLKVQTTCPMCREDLQKKKQSVKKVEVKADDEEEEWDDMYA